jgi:hypothetical protein
MKDEDIDELLRRADEASPQVDAALLDRISGSMQSSLRPVRPLMREGILVSGLLGMSITVAAAGAMHLGMYGIQEMSSLGIVVIFGALGILLGQAAWQSVTEMTPGSQRQIDPRMLLMGAVLILVTIFAFVFHDYRMDQFVPQGVVCLRAGLIDAIPVGLGSWLILRRGFAVNPSQAGLVSGTLAGLTGVIMLEMHCANFHTMHVMVWHTVVIPVSGLAGVVLARRR